MKLEEQVCNLELAKKLKELGVEQDSLWGWSKLEFKPAEKGVIASYDKSINWNVYLYRPEAITIKFQKLPESYSAFTVAELGEMLPNYIKLDIGIPYLFEYREGEKPFRYYKIEYSNFEKPTTTKPFCREQNLTEANARAKMLIYLLENGLIGVKR